MISILQKRYALTKAGAKGLLSASVTVFLKSFVNLLPAFVIMSFANQVIENTEIQISKYVIAVIVIAIIFAIVLRTEYITTYNETYKESENLRIEIAGILKELPLSYFNKHDVADLSQTVMKDVADIEHAMCHSIPQFIGLSASIIILTIMLLIGNVKLALCVILPILISYALMFLSKSMQKKITTKGFRQLRANSDAFQEAIDLQQEIKSYGQAENVAGKLVEQIEEFERIQVKSEFMQGVPVTVSGSILKFSLGATIMAGSVMYINGEVSLLYFLGYILVASRITEAVNLIYSGMAEIMHIDARINRINELRNTPTQQGEDTEINSYDIEFKNVSFSYDGERKVLDNVSFVAKQNEVTALVGPSGCGKTSALKLMSRLYDYNGGKILIDGKDIINISTDNLFEKISIVFQDVMLFNTTVMENIRIGNTNASDEEVIRAAKMANCHEFIEKMPEGYSTLIGENGSKLSGGERQRISIARAFLKNAPIILLDEISASLDVENEMKIQESLNALIKNKTVVIISHRLKSVEKVDKIIVMENGKVENMGKHEYLLENSKLYKNMIEKANMTSAYMY